METIYLSMKAQVAVGTFFMKGKKQKYQIVTVENIFYIKGKIQIKKRYFLRLFDFCIQFQTESSQKPQTKSTKAITYNFDR